MSSFPDQAQAVARVRKHFESGKTRPLAYRLRQLQAIRNLVLENKAAFVEAVQGDLRKPQLEASIGEVLTIVKQVDFLIENLYKWVKPIKVPTPLPAQPATSYIQPEPLGVILIIAPWNFPISLLLEPLAGAIAAGNSVILKPSEVSANSAKVLNQLIPKYLDPELVQVVLGAVEETSQLLEERFDKILYTGNGRVAEIILKKAAKYLTPVALELGGKSPVIVDKSASLDVAAKRIVNTKFFNAGQICIAPDYLLVHQDVYGDLVKKISQYTNSFYGSNPQESKSLGRIINEQHHKRIVKLIETAKGKVITGGKWDEKDKFIAPTVISDVDPNCELMKEEIFGPVLPILPVPNVKAAIDFINQRPRPLALYLFASDSNIQAEVVSKTSSGGVCLNDCIYHISNPNLPFGGVGPSGTGAYHGKASFDLFSHYKSVMNKRTWLDPSLRYPPYTQANTERLEMLFGGGGRKLSPKAIIGGTAVGVVAYFAIKAAL